MMNQSSQAAQQGINPWAAGAIGAGVGAGAVMTGQDIKTAKSRASWALALSVGIGGLMLVNAGNLNTASQQAQSVAQQLNGLTLSATTAAAGTDGANIRAATVNLANIVANVAYYANPFNFFSTAPTPQPVVAQLAAVTSGTIVTSNNNNNLAALLLVGGLAAVVALS